MALFKRKKKPVPAPQKQPKVLWSRSYPQSGTFRGYRRIRLSRYFHEQIDKTIAFYKKHGYDFKGRTIQLTCTRFDANRPDGCRIDVYADGKLLGSVWQSDGEQWKLLTENEIDKAHVRIEDKAPDVESEYIVTAKAYLFVHIV
jgi:hypothetical protein